MSQPSQRIGGLHSVRAALAHGAGRVVNLWYDSKRDDRRLGQLLTLAREAGVVPQASDRHTLDQLLPNANHQGVVAETLIPAALGEGALDDILTQLGDTPPLLLVLDGVTDPHNLGACLRSADAAGVQAVIAPRDRAVGLTPVACKVASGAAEHVPFIQVTNLARTLKRLRDSYGIWLVGTSGDAEAVLYDVDLKGPLAVVMGAEGKGMRRLTAEACDQQVKLPMAGTVASLNVSVATGICLFEAVRQRRWGDR